MRSKTILNILIIGGLVLGGLSLVAPTASAQKNGSLTFGAYAFSDPIKPLRPAVCQTQTVTFTADPSAYSGLIGVGVTYTVSKQPAWATVILSPSSDLFANPATPGTTGSYSSTRPLTVCITTSDQAPAFVNDQVEVSGTATAAAGSITGKTNFPIAADYFSIIDVNLQEAVKVDRPQTPVVFPLQITNLGNANTKVTILPDAPTGGLIVQTPQPVILQSKQAGGQQVTSTVSLTIQTPYHNGYLNQVAGENYKITSAYALDPKLVGDSSSVSVVLTTRGFYVPGFEPGLLVAALGGVALLLAIRR